jgi:hypothetical protein
MNIRYMLYGLAAAVYISVALQSYGFDDEFFNILLVERHGLSGCLLTQSTDVHPPLSYALNALLFQALGSWPGVRLISALALCAAFAYVCEHTARVSGNRAAVLTFLLLATNPAMLLWGTSVRWYAYFLPVLLWVLVVPQRQNWTLWARLALGMVILGYTGYITFILAPALVVLYWLSSRQAFKSKLVSLALSMGCAAVAYLPQMIVFINVHLANRGEQFGSAFLNVAGLFVAQFSNQGVFPISVAGLMGASGTLVLIWVALTSQPFRTLGSNPRALSYALFVALAMLSGIGAKFRNLVIATPLQALWFGAAAPKEGSQRVFYLGISLVLASNLWGVLNVYRHRDTTKPNWNLPVARVLSYVTDEIRTCDGDAVIFVHDPALTYHLEKVSPNVTGIYAQRRMEVKDSYRCAFVIRTFQGSIANETYAQMLEEVEGLRSSSKTVLNLDEDSLYPYVVKFDSRYPQHAVTIMKLQDVENVKGMGTWLSQNPWSHGG